MILTNLQILLLRIVLGGLFLHLGIGKLSEGWLTSGDQLSKSLENFHQQATGIQRLYIETVAAPHVSTWSRLIAAGETALGISLLIGLLVRLSTALGIFMVLNLHAATGNLYSLEFFGSAYAALIVTTLLVLLLARAGRWAGVDAILARSNPRGYFW